MRRTIVPELAGVVFIALVAACGGTPASDQAGEPATVVPTTAAAVASTSPPAPTSPATSAAPVAPVKPAKPVPPPPVTIEDGTWTVGEDVPPGVYKVANVVPSDCYWAILKSGTNGSDIVDNDIPGGGRPKVTLKRGQDFNTSDCGTWVKQ